MTENGDPSAAVAFDPPADHELEVTLFGRGNGECCVVHVGEGQWLIVDSFRVGRGRGAQPVARWYLDRLHVTRDQVFSIVVTHFDVDHYRGLADLHDWYNQAQLCYPSALRESNFRAIAAGGAVSKKSLGDWPEVFERATRRQLSGRSGYAGLHIRTDLDGAPDGVTVWALSPTDAAITAANLDLGQRLANVAEIRHYLKYENNCSVVLHLRFANLAILLGGDLLTNPPEFGWEAVVGHHRHRGMPRHTLVKVAHHGSDTSHYSELWEKWVDDDPILLVAPYRSEGLPRPSDVQRLLGHGGQLWQAAPSIEEPRLEAGQLLAKRETGSLGFVRARRAFTDGTWSTQAYPPGFHVEKPDARTTW